YYGGGWYEGCRTCDMAGDLIMPYWQSPQTRVAPLSAGLAFLQVEAQQQLLGQEETCYTYPTGSYGCGNNGGGTCTFHSGSISCSTFNGSTTCYGELYSCTQSGGETTCQEVDPGSVATQKYCYT